MGVFGIRRERLAFSIRAVLLLAGLSTYFFVRDDVVWRFIKTSPRARSFEHLCFGFAAAALGIALLLKIASGARQWNSRAQTALANLLQSIGIGSLLPLPGFVLLVIGDLGVSAIVDSRPPQVAAAERESASNGSRGSVTATQLRAGLIKNIGLGCAFISMVIFSIVLIDRVADVLFATTALISIAASTRASG